MRLPSPMVRALVGGTANLFTPGALPVGLQRAGLELATSLLPGPQVEAASEGGVPGERHRRRAGHGADGLCLLYLHGGGYSIGSPRTHRQLVARLAEGLQAEAFVPDYRLAPERPYPAALDDVTVAYISLIERFDEVVVAGDSAGGGLTLALALAIRARECDTRPPVALGLICPWLDLVGPHEHTGDPLITPARLERWKHAYAPGDRTDPGVSPLFGELTGLPPIVVHSAGDDPLLADAEGLAARAAVEHRRHPGQFHAFHVMAGITREADEAVDALAASLRAHCAARSAQRAA
jgi:epsilon-lactone hydrolase